MAHSEEDLPMVDGYVFVTSMKKMSLDGAKSNNWFLLFNFHDISLIRSTVEWALTSEHRKRTISGVEWDVKAGVLIIGIGGNANEFTYVRAGRRFMIIGMIERWMRWWRRSGYVKMVVLNENSGVTLVGFSF